MAIFDDFLFKLTPESKTELWQQLRESKTAEAVQETQNSGHKLCGYENEICASIFAVVYGSPSTSQWAPERMVNGHVVCSYAVFGDPAPGIGKLCGCRDQPFALRKRENSESLLQEALIFLVRFLARRNWAPFTGDRKFHGIELWSARHGGKVGGTLERFWIDRFLHESSQYIEGPRCLEWGIHYINRFSGCNKKFDVMYEPVHEGKRIAGIEGEVIYGSVYDFPSLIGPSMRFNFICATEVFEHLESPAVAARALYASLQPGGSVLYTGPQQAQYHRVPEDYLRYTKAEVKFLFEEAGFCVPKQRMSGSGDFVFDVGRDLGLVVQDFTLQEMVEGYQQGMTTLLMAPSRFRP